MMRRRAFITLLGSAAAAWPLAARAQQPERVRLIGVLSVFAKDDPEGTARDAAFQQTLADLGWTVGRNVRIDYRWGAHPNHFKEIGAPPGHDYPGLKREVLTILDQSRHSTLSCYRSAQETEDIALLRNRGRTDTRDSHRPLSIVEVQWR